MPDKACALELYDLQNDPEERHNLLAVNFQCQELDCFDVLPKLQIVKLIVLMHFPGAARFQASLGCRASNPPDGSLSGNGSGNLPTGGFC